MSLNSQEGPHDGTSLGASMLEQLAHESTNMVMASSNEGNSLNYISGTYEGDTLHTVVSGIPIAYAFSRKAGDMTFQIGIIDWETKKETWRSQPLSSADGGCSFRFMLNDSDDKTTPYEDIRSHLAAVVTGKITFSIGTMEDGRAKMFIALMATPAEHRLSFHITCPEDNIVDMWGDGAEFFRPSGNDYYTEGVTSMSMGDFVTGGTLISVGSQSACGLPRRGLCRTGGYPGFYIDSQIVLNM